ncbi:MAG: twin-arginine translocation signal domain-containing protein [Burkholderiaceae bacterium]
MQRRKFLSGAAAIGAVAAVTSAQAKPAAESLDRFAPAALEP